MRIWGDEAKGAGREQSRGVRVVVTAGANVVGFKLDLPPGAAGAALAAGWESE